MKYLNLVVLRSVDIEQTREILGLQFVRHAHGSGPQHYAHEDERGVFEIYPVKPGEPADTVGLGFAVGDLEAFHGKLASFRPGSIREDKWGRSFVVRDPDGRRVELKRA